MIKYVVKNKQGIETNSWTSAVADETHYEPCFGKPERIVPKSADYDPADVLEEIEHVMTSAIDEVVNESGEVVQEAIPAVTVKMVKLRAEYTVEIIDISAEAALAECLAKRKAEYPTAEEFLNVFFDGGESGLASLHAKRLEIKAKYPKP